MTTHHTFKVWYEGAHGRRTEPVERRIHISRTCQNCDHFRTESSDDWDIKDGNCMNLSYPSVPNSYCGDHQTAAEFEAGVHRIDRPVFTSIEGGAA